MQYDKLYPKSFSEPATYIRFSSTVEDSIGAPYCMDDEDVAILAKLNEGKDVSGNSRKDKLNHCSEDTFEEVMSFFEDTSQRLQPFANVDNAPVLSLEDMEQNVEENVSEEARRWMKVIYQHWMQRKDSRAIMPAIKVRVLDTSSEADDADPYVCFRRREVRQTRKTRGRDAQVVEKLKKLRLELEQARSLVQMVNQREQLNKQQLEMGRKVFEQRGQLKRVKIEKGIEGEKGADEELLVNQKVRLPLLVARCGPQLTSLQPMPKPKARQSTADRPATIKLNAGARPSLDRQTTENEIPSYDDQVREAYATLEQMVEQKKNQHKRWNEHWEDETWHPITPPADPLDEPPKWGFLPSPQAPSYPTPPPTEGSQKDGDVDMADAPAPLSPPQEADVRAGASPEPDIIIRSMPGAWPREDSPCDPPFERKPTPACRLRRGRGGIMHLEARKQRQPGLCRTVVTDSDDSEDDTDDWFSVSEAKRFDYRAALNRMTTMDRRSLGPQGPQDATSGGAAAAQQRLQPPTPSTAS